MFNPLLTTTHSKLDTRVKKPSGVGLGSTPDRFNSFDAAKTQNRSKMFSFKYL